MGVCSRRHHDAILVGLIHQPGAGQLQWQLRLRAQRSQGQLRKQTGAVGEFAANPWGIYQVHGNVWEWCEDVWHDDYNDAPSNGSAWLQDGDADRRVVRGGSWNYDPAALRSAFRGRAEPGDRSSKLGFRVGRTLTPKIFTSLSLGSRAKPCSIFFEAMAPMTDNSRRTGAAIEAHYQFSLSVQGRP